MITAYLVRPVLAAALISLGTSQSAQAAPESSPYQIHLAAEVSLTITVGAAVILLPRLLPPAELAEPPCRVVCDPQAIWLSLDRQVVGNDSARASFASDVLVSLLITGALAGSLIGSAASGGSADLAAGAGTDLLVALEVLLLAEGLAQASKYLVRRPRPYAYLSTVPLTRRISRQANLSFFSGHAALAFSSAAVLSYTTWARHPESEVVKGLVLGLSLAAAAATSYLRVAAGRHFWSDVIVGALVGAGVGVLIPALHEGQRQTAGSTAAAVRLPLAAAFSF